MIGWGTEMFALVLGIRGHLAQIADVGDLLVFVNLGEGFGLAPKTH